MKFRKMVFALAAVLLLPGCHSSVQTKVEHLDHSDYDVQAAGKVCRSNLYGDEKYYFDVCNNLKVKDELIGAYHDPFDTSLFVRYSADGLTTQQIEDIETIFGTVLSETHALFDNGYYYTDSENKRVNNLRILNESYGTGTTLEIDQRLYAVLREARQMTVLSQGEFNIFIGGISAFWDAVIEEAKDEILVTAAIDPSEYATRAPEKNAAFQKQIAAIPDLTGSDAGAKFDKILTLTSEGDKYFARFNRVNGADGEPIPKIAMTLGAIGKGFATELAKEALVEAGYDQGIIYGGGSSIVSLGPSYREKSWRINMTNPLERSSSVGTYNMYGQSNYTTSGDQERGFTFYLADGTTVRRHHIIDPTTGYPQNFYRSVSVEAPGLPAGLADAVSTTMMNLSPDTEEFGPSAFVEGVERNLSTFLNRPIVINFALFEETSAGHLTVYMTQGFKKKFVQDKNVKNVTLRTLQS